MVGSSFRSFSPDYSQPESPKPLSTKPAGSSGITLVLPSLKSLKAKKTTRHSSSRLAFPDGDIQEKRAPRPLKLKPLKEVLSKLIAQIKRCANFFLNDLLTDEDFRKDNYAFFLKPVDVANVPGYADLVKYSMDFGTMTDKVNRAKYRSLEDFAVSTGAIFSLAQRSN